MHGIKRGAAYLELADSLKAHLLPRLATLSQSRLQMLLDKTFPYISVEELSAVPLSVMMRLDAVAPVFLEELGKHAALYDKAPMKIKRQIWAIDYDLFKAHVFPVLEPYLRAREASLESPLNEVWGRALEEPRQRRRNTPAIGAVLSYLDKSRPLYRSLLELCWRLYREDGNPMFCALRSDVLMALHDAGVTELYQHDPYHELCWILDAGTRERSFSDTLLRDLTGALDKLRTVKSSKERADQAMLLASPYVMHALLRSACTALLRAVHDKALPSDAKRCPSLDLLAKLLVRAASARDLLLKKSPALSPKVARHDLLTVLCPWLASLVVTGMLEDRGSVPAPPVNAPAPVVPAGVASLLASELAARKLLQAFVVMRVESGEPSGLPVMLAAAAAGIDASTDGDFVQSLVTALLAGMRSSNSTTTKWLSVQQAVTTGFLSRASRLGVQAHLQSLRFLDAALIRMPVPHVLTFLKQLVESAGAADYVDKDIMLRYVTIMEQLVPDKVSDEEVQFLLDFLHLEDD